VVQQPVAHVAAVHVQELAVGARAVHRRQSQQSAQCKRPRAAVEHPVRALVFVTERRQRARLPGRRRPRVAAAPVDPQREPHLGVRQRNASPGVQAVRGLGAIRLEELAPGGRGRVQIEDLDRRAPRARRRLDATGGAVEQVRVRVALCPARDPDACHRSDRGQRLAAESQRGHALEVVERADLAGGVPLQRQREFVGRDAAAVVADEDAAHAALLDAQFDRRGARVDRVLEQLLDDRCGPFDHLAGGDLADQHIRKRLDRPTLHACRTLRHRRHRHRLVGRGFGRGHARGL